ncbi:DUF5686 family protein [Flavobacteriaceae bacterium 14752]|uniref:DUF5686 family protein n=1 Tax=Mesohalobacter salilacus TaxID=2491711 RepID=UPI000F64241C|nr:hypothetical protein EIG84_08825 [Flavobacteriaceae bacterium 14752]
MLSKLIAQQAVSTNLINQNSEPVAFAVAITSDTVVFSNVYGHLQFKKQPNQLKIYALGYKPVTLEDFQLQVTLQESEVNQNNADQIIAKVFKNANTNDPFTSFNKLGFKRYNRTLIQRDSIQNSVSNENLFSERTSEFLVQNQQIKERIVAQNNQGFDKPVLKMLSHRMHDINWYDKDYVIFEIDYASPLHPDNIKAYQYELIHKSNEFYYIKFSPKLNNADRLLQGVMQIDNNYALSKIYANKDDEIKLDLHQNFEKNSTQNLWLTQEILVEMTPGEGGKPVSLFGTNVDIGTLQSQSIAEVDQNNKLSSKSIFYSYSFEPEELDTENYDILVEDNAHTRNTAYWESKRKLPLTSQDSLFFKGTAQTLKRQKTISRIKKLENVNDGFFPIFKWKTDLKTLIKVNNFEGLRLGIGGLTNEEFSDQFRVGGYIAYGTKDKQVKFGVNTGFLLDRDTNTWLNAEYTDDVREVGSNIYLTDERVYSLFEPRLVNIIFFYKEKTTSLSLQRRLTPNLLSEFKIAHDRIFQTENYAFLNGDIALQSYDLTRALVSLRWSPRSRFLKFDNNFINVKEQYPVISGQVEQYFGSTFGGDLTFTKLNLKGQYIYNHLNNSHTEFILEGNYAFGDVPLTHSFHAYPNAPNDEKILGRFSVAGVKSFETMFFSEFFSTRLASLHIKHTLAPFKISNTFRPEMVLISRHAIGDFSDQEKHLNVDFNTLNQGYSEAGVELNKIFWGFGLSFAYRYGAYHLPNFDDNIAFKFTFNLQL